MTAELPRFELRHARGPNATYLVMGGLMEGFLIYTVYARWWSVIDALVASAFVLFYVGFHLASLGLYKAKVAHGTIAVRPFGSFKWRSMAIASIDRVQVKRLSPDLSRADGQLPTSRVEFHDRESGFVAVSLTHFRRDDLKRLVATVAQARPDLRLPKI